MKRLAWIIMIGSLLVLASRVVDAFLLVYSETLDTAIATLQGQLHVATGAIGAIVLTGAQTLTFHSIMQRHGNATLRRLLFLLWLLLLAAIGYILAPMFILALQSSPLIATVQSPAMQWLFAVCMVLVFELGSACVAGVLALEVSESPVAQGGVSIWGRLAEGATQVAEAAMQRKVAELHVTHPATQHTTDELHTSQDATQHETTELHNGKDVATRRAAVQQWLAAGQPVSQADLAAQLHVDPSTISRDLRVIARNGR